MKLPDASVFTVKSSGYSTIHDAYDTSVPVQQRHSSFHVMLCCILRNNHCNDTPVNQMSHEHIHEISIYMGLSPLV